YLAPASFPMTLHVAKIVLDLAKVTAVARGWGPAVVLAGLSAVNVAQARDATGPTVIHRQKLMAAVRDIRDRRPVRVVADAWTSYFLTEVYLKDLRSEVEVVPPLPVIYTASQHATWL